MRRCNYVLIQLKQFVQHQKIQNLNIPHGSTMKIQLVTQRKHFQLKLLKVQLVLKVIIFQRSFMMMSLSLKSLYVQIIPIVTLLHQCVFNGQVKMMGKFLLQLKDLKHALKNFFAAYNLKVKKKHGKLHVQMDLLLINYQLQLRLFCFIMFYESHKFQEKIPKYI